MCRAMSGYAAIIGDAVKLWISEKTDSHSEIAIEFSLRDNGKHRLYAFEFYPDESKSSSDAATWRLNWDSDATLSHRDKPSAEDELRFRGEIEKSVQKYIFRDGSHKTTACRAWVFGEAELVARGSSRVEARESSRVEARGSSRVEAWGSSSVVARGSSSVVAWESSTTNSYGPKPASLNDKSVWIDRSGEKPVVTITGSK